MLPNTPNLATEHSGNIPADDKEDHHHENDIENVAGFDVLGDSVGGREDLQFLLPAGAVDAFVVCGAAVRPLEQPPFLEFFPRVACSDILDRNWVSLNAEQSSGGEGASDDRLRSIGDEEGRDRADRDPGLDDLAKVGADIHADAEAYDKGENGMLMANLQIGERVYLQSS